MIHQGQISDDVKGLLKLAPRRGQSDRNKLFEKVAMLMEERDATLNADERSLMGDILHSLVKNVEMTVRIKLAERLVDSAKAPSELINLLANDEIEVAYPILKSSEILSNQDLINVIKHRSLQYQLAVAIRKNLPEEISEALVETGNEHVIVTLISNDGAHISGQVLNYLAEKSKRIDRFQGPLLQRDDLPTHLAAKMYDWVWRHCVTALLKISMWNIRKLTVRSRELSMNFRRALSRPHTLPRPQKNWWIVYSPKIGKPQHFWS